MAEKRLRHTGSNPRLKIAMVFFSDPSEAGGVQEYVYFLSDRLARLGHTVDLFGADGVRKLPYRNYHPVMGTIKVPNFFRNWSSWTVPTAPLSEALSQKINAGGYDLVHIHDPFIPFVAFDLVQHIAIPKVATFHTSWDGESEISYLSNVLPLFHTVYVSSFAGTLYVSKTAAACWKPMTEGTGIPTAIVPCGTNPDIVPAPGTGRPPRHLLFVARLVHRKGLMYLLEAVSMLHKEFPDMRLDVLGAGDERERAVQYVAAKKLGKCVTFRGEIVGPEKLPYFAGADIFCAPYANEGLPVASLEALSAGLPIVGFKTGAFDELLKEYPDRSMLVAQKDVAGLAGAIRKLFTDPDLHRRLRDWSVAESKKYSWDRTAREVDSFYRTVLTGTKDQPWATR
jgi:glycosyltransferase involved in cell wall biosynthesis